MAGDWEKEIITVDMRVLEAEVIKSLLPEELVLKHTMRFIDPIFPNTARLECSCGAKWSISIKEFDAGITHIDDHRAYAKRTATRVD